MTGTARLFATRSAHAHGRLECVIDPPLEASQSTNHQDTGTETLGSQVDGTGLAGNLANRLALVLSLAHEGDDRVGRVGDDGADNTGEVTRGEGDTELGALAVGLLGFSEDVGVEQLDDLLEEEELGHGVGDLTRPEGNEGTEGVASLNLCPGHLLESSTEGSGEGTGSGSLDLDLGHFEGA